ncbi:MAG TPA: response regulator [Myxococcaceae bacterium]|jgi:CheY-like chemotaxis protein
MGPILIVDDEFGIVEVIRDFLQDEGYRTAIALNGRQALDLMAVQRPVMVLLDYMMPVMNGGELLEVMKTHPEWSTIPVVLMSASPPREWQQLPAYSLLLKPFGLAELIAAVHHAVGQAPKR